MTTRPVFILLCGLPGVGKSTYSRRSQFDNYVRLSADDYLIQAMEKEGISYQESFASNILQAQFEIVENLKAAVSGGSNIILDQLNLTPAVRRKKLLRIPPEIYTRIAVSFVEDSEVLVERNRERLKNGMGMPEEVLKIYINTYVPPSVKEGFDEIWSPGEIRL